MTGHLLGPVFVGVGTDAALKGKTVPN
jgi:hypothetical protein